jgi:hypothetical protein
MFNNGTVSAKRNAKELDGIECGHVSAKSRQPEGGCCSVKDPREQEASWFNPKRSRAAIEVVEAARRRSR